MKTSQDCMEHAPHVGSDDFEDLASAVSALTADDLAGIADSLSCTDCRDYEDTGGHEGGGFLANLF